MKAIMHLVCILVFSLGHLMSIFMLKYDWAFLYPYYKWCMNISFKINERFKLTVWK